MKNKVSFASVTISAKNEHNDTVSWTMADSIRNVNEVRAFLDRVEKELTADEQTDVRSPETT